jgi:hypothetical protein
LHAVSWLAKKAAASGTLVRQGLRVAHASRGKSVGLDGLNMTETC